MTVDEAKKKIKEIEAERRKLAYERDEMQAIVNKARKEEELEIRKGMLNKCYYSENRKRYSRYGKSYSNLVAFRVDKISDTHNYMECLCILYSECDGYLHLDKMRINPFNIDCDMLMPPRNCPRVIDDFKEINEERFESLCWEVVQCLMEKGEWAYDKA